jgi:hypothetical protein
MASGDSSTGVILGALTPAALERSVLERPVEAGMGPSGSGSDSDSDSGARPRHHCRAPQTSVEDAGEPNAIPAEILDLDPISHQIDRLA